MSEIHDYAGRIDWGVLPLIGALLAFFVFFGGGATWAAVTIVRAML